MNNRASVRSICLIHFVGWQCARRIITHSSITRGTMRQSLIGSPTKRLGSGSGNATTQLATSTRQYNSHELCNPFECDERSWRSVNVRSMPDFYMFPYMLPTDDMLSSIHKHFSSLEVERTCWVADWQHFIHV